MDRLIRDERDRPYNSGPEPPLIAAAQNVDSLCAENEGMIAGLDAVMFSVITGAWTAVETLAGDLWVAAVNASPNQLGQLSGLPKRIAQKGNTRIAKTEPVDDTTRDIGDKEVSLNDIHFIARGNYDLSRKMGDLLRGRFKFTTLTGIRKAYSVAFSEKLKKAKPDALDAALADKSLDALSIVRNMIVHRAAVADQDYCDDARSGVPNAPKLDFGQRLCPDGEMVRDLINPPILRGIDLISAVDKWLASAER